MSNLRIIANPNIYKLKYSISNYKIFSNYDYTKITYNIPDIEIEVSNKCEDSYIKMYDKNNILYCEKAVCQDSCPVDITALCIPYNQDSKTNDKENNICQCMEGWTGAICNEKVFIDYGLLSLLYILIIIYMNKCIHYIL